MDSHGKSYIYDIDVGIGIVIGPNIASNYWLHIHISVLDGMPMLCI